ncbi:hypothetical protein PV325_009595, partial [Microctonus aethiopoides]
GNRNVIDMHCSCVARCSKRCKHIYALLHFIRNHRSTSKTSFEQTWGKPSVTEMSKKLYSKGKTCAQLFPPKAELITDLKNAYNFCPQDFKNINCVVREIVVLENRNKEEIERRSTLKRLNEQRNVLEEYERIETCHKLFFTNHVALDDDQIISTCIRTKIQSNSVEWNECRQLRITASEKAHRINKMKKVKGKDLAVQFMNKKTTENANFKFGLRKE